jgi:hypothetical protein
VLSPVPRFQPHEEIGWQSERTASAWGPTYRVLPCHPCNRAGSRWELSTLGPGLLLVLCFDCGGAGWYAELVGTPPIWVLPW